jgi:hypothetical protein
MGSCEHGIELPGSNVWKFFSGQVTGGFSMIHLHGVSELVS